MERKKNSLFLIPLFIFVISLPVLADYPQWVTGSYNPGDTVTYDGGIYAWRVPHQDWSDVPPPNDSDKWEFVAGASYDLAVGGSFSVVDKEYDGAVAANFDENNLYLNGVQGSLMYPTWMAQQYYDTDTVSYNGRDYAFLENDRWSSDPPPDDTAYWEDIGESQMDEDDVSLSNIVIEFASSDVGNDIMVTIVSADLAGTDAAAYTLDLDGAPTATANITPAPLTVEADDKSKTYDGDPYTGFTVTYTGFVSGDDETDLDGSLDFSGDAVDATDVGEYTITPEGFTSDNYEITFEDGELSIGARTLNLSDFDADSKIYDGTTDVTGTGFSDDRVS
ncbi:MBG domain-containing protein, partial [Chitinivibrio alkaliphilus]|uniref:MBG domain-containing protein n=1 Tax=Chitinivibrio alkaliphilus TaxID=1505232 RepID=UPI00054D35D0